MYITVTLQIDDTEIDISMDEQQSLAACLQVLKDNYKVVSKEEPAFYRSVMQLRIVSAHKSLKEEDIANGDKLIAVTE